MSRAQRRLHLSCLRPQHGPTWRRRHRVLDYVPGRFRVIRHVRPKYACRRCDAITQAPAPALPTPRGRAAPGMLAHLLVSKYCDHLPLYRQSQIYARDGLDLDRSTLSDWVGQAVWLLHRSSTASETTSSPPRRSTPTTRRSQCWSQALAALGPDDCGSMSATTARSAVPHRRRRSTSTAPIAVARIQQPGFLQADAYSGFAALYEPRKVGPGLPVMPAITEVAC